MNIPLKRPFSMPSKLTKCKYELWQNGKQLKAITTDQFNREVMLKTFIEFGETRICKDVRRDKPFPYFIYITEKNVRELYINSSLPNHRKFIEMLCQQESSI